MNKLIRKIFSSLMMTVCLLGAYGHGVQAAANEFVIVIKEHKFSPVELTVPAHTKVKLRIENQDTTPEEFESFDLNREKVVSGNGKITVFIGPLKPGTYRYFGEFHKDFAQGVIIAK